MTSENGYKRLAPTVAAIDAWRAKSRKGTRGPIYGADIRTKAGSWRCVSGHAHWTDGVTGFWTIRAEGKSSEGRQTAIRPEAIVAARGWVVV